MTGDALQLFYPVDSAAASLQRVIDIARRAVRGTDALLLAATDTEIPLASAHDAIIEAPVMFGGKPIARLVVRDKPGRIWSGDDEAILRDLTAGLAEEIRLLDLVSRLEARQTNPEAPDFSDADEADPAAADRTIDASADGKDAGVDEGLSPGAFNILLADDLDLNRKLICDMLSLDGYVVDSVADGAAAVEAVKVKVYDLVLMDMIMPVMNGIDATRAIRALPAPTCDVPIVALTAHSFREQLDNCLHAGMNATLTKPMSFDALSSAVSTWARRAA